MRHRPRLDGNQRQVVEALRAAGATVRSLAALGQGCPDLLVGWSGRNLLIEVKDSSRPASKRRLTPDEQAFVDRWRGQVVVVETVEQALALLRDAA